MAEERLLTLDYSLAGHEFYIAITSKGEIQEMHFRTASPLPPGRFLQFVFQSFEQNRDRVQAALAEFLKKHTDD